jgi:hypothetical protein
VAEQKEQGVMSNDSGKFIPVDKREPYSPENLHMSKKDFIEAQRKRKEKALRMKEIAAQYDLEHGVDKIEDKEPETKDVKRSPGRPKKIE